MNFHLLIPGLLLACCSCGFNTGEGVDPAPGPIKSTKPAGFKASADWRIQFIGNSHTGVNDIPGMVKKLAESDGSGRTVDVAYQFTEHLNDVTNDPYFLGLIGQNCNIVVLQAAMVSSSLSRSYPQGGGISLGKEAKRLGKRLVLFVEWPRKGIDESTFTVNEYKKIAVATGAEIVPACYAFDLALSYKPHLPMWAPDGNHSSVLGAYLAALSIYYHLTGDTNRSPTWHPEEVDPQMSAFFIGIAKRKH